MDALESIRAEINDDLIVRQRGEADIHILDAPWQVLGTMVEEAAQRARWKDAADKRACMRDTPELDRAVMMTSINKRTDEEKRILTYILSGAAWTNACRHEIGK
eukprot:9658870-Karenia_brevis.AAC.1